MINIKKLSENTYDVYEKDEYDLDLYELYEKNYYDDNHCKICGAELIKVTEHHEAWGVEFRIPVFICSNNQCPNS